MKKSKPPKAKAGITPPLPGTEPKVDLRAIVDFLDRTPHQAYTFKTLARKLNVITKPGKIDLADMIEHLHKAQEVAVAGDGTIQSVKGKREYEGYVDFVNPKFAWITRTGLDNDIRVQAEDLKLALDGDHVRVRLYPSKNDKNLQGEVIEILERKREVFVGRLIVERHFSFVVPDNKRTHFDIFVTGDLKGAVSNDKVTIRITDWGTPERNPVGTIEDVLGAAGENNTEMHAIMAEFGLPYYFDESVEEEANAIATSIPAEEIAKRRDFRGIPTFTIDPFDAKDFDDALSFRKLDNGRIEVGVHIADVTHYVLPGTKLEIEAYHRATSVYLVDRTIPMLPEALSNNLCSLRPHEDKLTFSAVFELDSQGRVLDEWFGRTIIHSNRRFTYEEAQEIIEGQPGDFQEEILELNRLHHILRAERFAKGSIGFETPEVKFVLDENGVPLKVIPKVRKDAHKLIEEFMLLANKNVATFIYNMRKGRHEMPMVYRIHEAPNAEKIRVFSAFARKFGYKVSTEEKELASSLNHLITALEGQPEEDVLQNLAIRTMAKARYATEPIGHFGLAFDHYSHFTSPIRRYPDMMCHRLLQHYLDGGAPADVEELNKQCQHSSEREKVAAEAERASIKYKQVEYMKLQPDVTFDGIVSGVTEWGFYVEIVATKCEGLVRITDLHDDYYEFDPDNYRLIGTRHKRIIAFGDEVEVRVKATNLEKRTIDLELVDEELDRYKSMRGAQRGTNVRAKQRRRT